jgi:hypothetical protein
MLNLFVEFFYFFFLDLKLIILLFFKRSFLFVKLYFELRNGLLIRRSSGVIDLRLELLDLEAGLIELFFKLIDFFIHFAKLGLAFAINFLNFLGLVLKLFFELLVLKSELWLFELDQRWIISIEVRISLTVLFVIDTVNKFSLKIFQLLMVLFDGLLVFLFFPLDPFLSLSFW